MINNDSQNNISIKINGEDRSMRLFPLVACVDSMARPLMQGIVQFNGKYGCNWCLHPGEYFARSIKYPVLDHHPEDRDAKTTIALMNEVQVAKHPMFGVKHAPHLINLPYFDIIFSFVPDYMHFTATKCAGDHVWIN